MRAIPSYTPGTAPRTWTATVKQRGLLVWSCRHSHPTEQDARACAIGEAEVMKCQTYLPCPKCREDVEYTIEHLNVTNGDWTCQPRKTTRRTTNTRSSV